MLDHLARGPARGQGIGAALATSPSVPRVLRAVLRSQSEVKGASRLGRPSSFQLTNRVDFDFEIRLAVAILFEITRLLLVFNYVDSLVSGDFI